MWHLNLLLSNFHFVEVHLNQILISACATKCQCQLQGDTFSTRRHFAPSIKQHFINNLNQVIMANSKENQVTRPEDGATCEITAKVLRVENVFDDRQLNITLNTEIEKFDIKAKEMVKSNVLVKRLKSVTEDVATCVPTIRRVVRRAMGKQINPVLLSIVLENADIKMVGVYHHENTKREFDGATESDVYTSDCWVYRITEVTTHLTNEDLQDFDEVRKEEPYLVTAAVAQLPAWLKSGM